MNEDQRLKPLEAVSRIEALEVELTRLNAVRALSETPKRLEVLKLGSCTLLREKSDPASPYYNRVKGFGAGDVPLLDEILDVYAGGSPCFDMTPDKLSGDTAAALAARGYIPAEQLTFMEALPQREETSPAGFDIAEVTAADAEEFIRWIGLSTGGKTFSTPLIERAQAYFHAPYFRNYMVRIDARPAAMASLFLHGGEGYLANDYTFPDFRGRGLQLALIRHRMSEAAVLGLQRLYTDVEFGSASHGNMEKAGFRTAFINTFWMKGE